MLTFLIPSGSTFPIELVIDTGFTSMILEELQDDLRCDRAFASSPDALAKLAATATHAKNNRMSFILRHFYVERDS